MHNIENDYNLQIDRLRKLIKPQKTFAEAIELALEIHAITHTGEVSSSSKPTFCDELLDGLTDEDFHAVFTENDKPIAYHLWHIARIEDLVGNILIAEQPQIFNAEWMAKLNTSTKDTGNAMACSETVEFSKQLNKQELINYRNAVGCQTRKILKSLTHGDLKKKPTAECLQQIVTESGLIEDKNSIWLKDFWGRHTVSGLIVLPLTRHHMMHLPDCFVIKRIKG